MTCTRVAADLNINIRIWTQLFINVLQLQSNNSFSNKLFFLCNHAIFIGKKKKTILFNLFFIFYQGIAFILLFNNSAVVNIFNFGAFETKVYETMKAAFDTIRRGFQKIP